ncbi:MAG: hypothetical protein N4A39_15690 [Roseicyclus sp.]|nr:hypothetical protein [Roseicyclus sp.]
MAEFKTLLKGQSREVSVAIAFRAAMRVFPRLGHNTSAALFLRMARSSIISACFAVRPEAFDNTFLSGSFYATAADTFSSFADAAFSAHFATFDEDPDSAVASVVHASTRERAEGYSEDDDKDNALSWSHHLWRQAEADALIVQTTGPERLFRTPLWPQSEPPPEFSQAVEDFLNFSRHSDYPWAFWTKWFCATMAGDPLPWDLQEKIALIPDETWDSGPEAVAEEIARIEAAFELRQRIAEVEADQVSIADKRLGIGGNNPPEEIADPETAQQVVILWESIAGLKEQVEAEEPDAERVAVLIERLGAALRTVIAWCGRKGDLIVDTSIKWGIPAAGGGYFLVNPAKAEAVLKAAQAWLPFLAP